ncbi:MAG: hypothetical protein LBF02_01685 [Mycoplasmataceae bacterium]|nr:hypothetical protein [Mycoplasmataceae bacterium]
MVLGTKITNSNSIRKIPYLLLTDMQKKWFNSSKFLDENINFATKIEQKEISNYILSSLFEELKKTFELIKEEKEKINLIDIDAKKIILNDTTDNEFKKIFSLDEIEECWQLIPEQFYNKYQLNWHLNFISNNKKLLWIYQKIIFKKYNLSNEEN